MGLDDFNSFSEDWYEAEVFVGTGDPTAARPVRAWSTWSLVRKTLWCLAWIPASIWAAVLGIIALICFVTVIGLPLGIIIGVYAGLPGAILLGKALQVGTPKDS